MTQPPRIDINSAPVETRSIAATDLALGIDPLAPANAAVAADTWAQVIARLITIADDGQIESQQAGALIDAAHFVRALQATAAAIAIADIVDSEVHDWAEADDDSPIPAAKLANQRFTSALATKLAALDVRTITSLRHDGGVLTLSFVDGDGQTQTRTTPVAGGGGPTSGLTQAQVLALIADWAEEGNTDPIPAAKLANQRFTAAMATSLAALDVRSITGLNLSGQSLSLSFVDGDGASQTTSAVTLPSGGGGGGLTQAEVDARVVAGTKPFAQTSGGDIQSGDIGAKQVEQGNIADDAVGPDEMDADTATKRAAIRRRIGASEAGNDEYIIPIAETTITVGTHGSEPTLDIGFQRTPAATNPYGMIAGSTDPYPFTVDGVEYLLYAIFGDDIGSIDSGTFVINIYRQTDGADGLGGKLAFDIDGTEYVLADSPTVPNASGVSEWQFTNAPNPYGRTSGADAPLRIRQAWERIQSDYGETDTASPAYIRRKPTTFDASALLDVAALPSPTSVAMGTVVLYKDDLWVNEEAGDDHLAHFHTGSGTVFGTGVDGYWRTPNIGDTADTNGPLIVWSAAQTTDLDSRTAAVRIPKSQQASVPNSGNNLLAVLTGQYKNSTDGRTLTYYQTVEVERYATRDTAAYWHYRTIAGGDAVSDVPDGTLLTLVVYTTFDSVARAYGGQLTLVDAVDRWVPLEQSEQLAGTNRPGLMSAADYTKLMGIGAGAEVNVQSDWSQSNASADSYIANKPSAITASISGNTVTIAYDGTTRTFDVPSGGGGGGLTQAQVDARVAALVEAAGLLANATTRWPLTKVPQGLVTGGSLSGSVLTLTKNGATADTITLPSGTTPVDLTLTQLGSAFTQASPVQNQWYDTSVTVSAGQVLLVEADWGTQHFTQVIDADDLIGIDAKTVGGTVSGTVYVVRLQFGTLIYFGRTSANNLLMASSATTGNTIGLSAYRMQAAPGPKGDKGDTPLNARTAAQLAADVAASRLVPGDYYAVSS